MNEQEQLMDNLLNVDLEIIDVVRELHQGNWDSISMKEQVGDLLKIRDEMVQKLMSMKGDDHSCDCGHDHAHE
ncbi:hypothetical protein C5F47_05085 [Nitrosopumilus cobalaminigenes]|uniref:Uncharacterized protein n=1 Tax=Nitrosopumilus cobalaminigenes TaxID=1470066 RepID=A0A7D5LZD5_9ARCH|nr:hypothetical protein [Nitrosopumilus cobalaminigenes]QLH02966.1 hypothetical protein C5F47_05085 [Nitrosopumilus cobalaminigenes]